ncbi:hypothetical protein DFJ73DRAFT_967106 [Zopfochytrium polystomum]|nr:hypothetical protein DFJ73DRAFT_967106 [Zopfochytrium polystomum]
MIHYDELCGKDACIKAPLHITRNEVNPTALARMALLFLELEKLSRFQKYDREDPELVNLIMAGSNIIDDRGELEERRKLHERTFNNFSREDLIEVPPDDMLPNAGSLTTEELRKMMVHEEMKSNESPMREHFNLPPYAVSDSVFVSATKFLLPLTGPRASVNVPIGVHGTLARRKRKFNKREEVRLVHAVPVQSGQVWRLTLRLQPFRRTVRGVEALDVFGQFFPRFPRHKDRLQIELNMGDIVALGNKIRDDPDDRPVTNTKSCRFSRGAFAIAIAIFLKQTQPPH